jgi:hypothetical protein
MKIFLLLVRLHVAALATAGSAKMPEVAAYI